MFPDSISEKLMFNTIKLVASDGSSGTGSFFNFNIDGNIVPTIITNKHVVLNHIVETVRFSFHLKTSNDSYENYEVSFSAPWIQHPKYDLCFCFVNPVIEEVMRKTGKQVFFLGNSDDIIPSVDNLKNLSALEETVMVGYPIGLSDERNNYPIFRKGYTAAHPAIDFNEDGIGLVDMACFPGSSGSPIYILNEGGFIDKKGNLNWGKSRLYLLGFLFAGPIYNASGQVVKNTPTNNFGIKTGIMTNLGYYIKSSAVLDFKENIRKILKVTGQLGNK